MLLTEPNRTDYDLHFSLGGVPVRVHPLFWVAGLVLGARDLRGENALIYLLMWVAVIFVSILIHEMGHAVAMRLFGESPRVVLYLMGGLAIADQGGWSDQAAWGTPTSRGRSSGQQILISLAGPGAGFLLAAVVVILVHLSGGGVQWDLGLRSFPPWDLQLTATSPLWFYLVSALLYVNIFWGLVNLLPVYPLDGGQIAREFFVMKDPWQGITRSLWLSVFVGGGMAVIGMLFLQSLFVALLFGSLAVSSYMALQQLRGGGFGGGRW